ncbi:hypothetical protein [Curtobacterium sp. 9128]|nr:hypothetical protein [Curtobacterium sp. 9128]
MSHELDRTTLTIDDQDCWPAHRALHDEPAPRFGRYLGLINAQD